jgi:hypothetical protein
MADRRVNECVIERPAAAAGSGGNSRLTRCRPPMSERVTRGRVPSRRLASVDVSDAG